MSPALSPSNFLGVYIRRELQRDRPEYLSSYHIPSGETDMVAHSLSPTTG